jgi:hypothetical protein
MKKLNRCLLCGKKILAKTDSFVLNENIEDWDYESNRTKILKTGSVVCSECLIDFIDDTERVPKTLPQIVFKYIGTE